MDEPTLLPRDDFTHVRPKRKSKVKAPSGQKVYFNRQKRLDSVLILKDPVTETLHRNKEIQCRTGVDPVDSSRPGLSSLISELHRDVSFGVPGCSWDPGGPRDLW